MTIQELHETSENRSCENKQTLKNPVVEAGPASFLAVKKFVAEHRVNLTFIFGPPRGGTTAAERWVYESFHFDGNVNQPGLMSRDEKGGRDRIETLWSAVHDKVIECQRTNPGKHTVDIVVKETSNVVLPKVELKLWQEVSSSILLVYHNPVLQVESRICCILNRISAGTTTDLNVPPSMDPCTCTVHGKWLFKPSTDFSHIDESSDVSLWEQHYLWMKKHRDYTSLDVGFIHFSTLHPLFEEPSVQLSCLNLFASFNPELDITKKDILECIGTKLEDFNSLPSFFHQAFSEWRFGWIEFVEQINNLYENCHKPEMCNNIALIDMSDLQSCPEFFLKILGNVIKKKEQKHTSREKGGVGTNSNASGVGIPNGAGGDSGRDFDVSSKGVEWDTWFMSSCDWDKMGKASSDILPPKKKSISFLKFPDILKRLLPDMMESFVALKSENKADKQEIPETATHGSDVDPQSWIRPLKSSLGRLK